MVTITLTEKQLRLLQTAMEEYFRLRMGQAWDFADDICAMNVDVFDPDNPKHDRIFEKFLLRRDIFKTQLEAMIRTVAFENDLDRMRKTNDMLIAEDMWRVIRHWFWEQRPDDQKSHWTVDSDKPRQWGGEPLVRIEAGE